MKLFAHVLQCSYDRLHVAVGDHGNQLDRLFARGDCAGQWFRLKVNATTRAAAKRALGVSSFL